MYKLKYQHSYIDSKKNRQVKEKQTKICHYQIKMSNYTRMYFLLTLQLLDQNTYVLHVRRFGLIRGSDEIISTMHSKNL